MDNLPWLGQIHPSGRSEVGDKAFYLNEAARKGYPIAPGFVIPAVTLPTWLQLGDWQEPLLVDLLDSSLHLNIDDADELQAIAQNIRHQLLMTPLPDEWMGAIESAVASWEATTLIFRPSLSMSEASSRETAPNLSQLLESHLSANQPEELARAVKLTWAELFRARSLFWTQRFGISLKQIRLGVLVQPVERAIASGSLNAHPTGFEIQATVGASVAMSYGDVIPDSYQIDRVTGQVQSQKLGRKACTYEATEIGWQPQILMEEGQQEYALETPHLETLIDIAQKLVTDFAPDFQLEWMLTAPGEREADTSLLLLTRIYPLEPSPGSMALDVDRPTPSDSTEDPASIRGIAVSSGVTISQSISIDNLDAFPPDIPPGRILVAASMSLDWLPQIQQAAGLVTEQGGTTSHGAILARELGIPAVVGIANATQLFSTGKWIQVDGDRGEVCEISTAPKTSSPQTEHREAQTRKQPNPQTLKIPIATQLLLNLSQVSLIDDAVNLPVDGVGLIRGERMARFDRDDGQNLDRQNPHGGQHETAPTEMFESLIEQLLNSLSQFARRFAPRPIYYRSHNFSNDSQSNLALGIQGTFRYQIDPTLFDVELDAIARVRKAGYTNLNLILPFVRTVEEFEFCRDRIERAGLLPQTSFKLWIMAEVPSVVFLLPDFVRAGVQGIAIGSNDLTQLILAADRDRSQMARVFEARHPAVMGAIRQLIETARSLDIPCSICGDAPVRYPELVDALVEWGITAISVPPKAVESTYRAIARAERRLLIDAARRQL